MSYDARVRTDATSGNYPRALRLGRTVSRNHVVNGYRDGGPVWKSKIVGGWTRTRDDDVVSSGETAGSARTHTSTTYRTVHANCVRSLGQQRGHGVVVVDDDHDHDRGNVARLADRDGLVGTAPEDRSRFPLTQCARLRIGSFALVRVREDLRGPFEKLLFTSRRSC